MTTRAALELPFQASCDAIHCPACGAMLRWSEGEESCPHLAYVYFDEVGEFTGVPPHLEVVLNEVLDDEEALGHPVDRVR